VKSQKKRSLKQKKIEKHPNFISHGITVNNYIIIDAVRTSQNNHPVPFDDPIAITGEVVKFQWRELPT
jgi:hypothetical protein